MVPTKMPIESKRLQIPARFVFAMNISTMYKDNRYTRGIKFGKPVLLTYTYTFEYVACARVGKLSDLFAYAPKGKITKILYIQKPFNKSN